MLVNFLEFFVYTLCVADKLPMRMSAGQQCSRAWHGRAGQPHSISIFHSIFIFPAQLKAKKTFQWLQPSYLTAGSGLCGAFCCHSCVCKCAWVCVRCVCVCVFGECVASQQFSFATLCRNLQRRQRAWPQRCRCLHFAAL